MLRKIEAMYARYGRAPGLCKECSHLIRKLYQHRYVKCELYGNSNSEATDWAQKYQACGMKDKPLPEKFTPIVRFVAIEARQKQSEPELAGQIDLFGGQEKRQ
jgi:hypothetical protein